MDFSAWEPLASAVLYEGYQLYPYRPTALKNQQRWNFGTLFPEAFARAAGANDPWRHQIECLAANPPPPAGTALRIAPKVEARLQFLHAAEAGGDVVRTLQIGPVELVGAGMAQTGDWGQAWGLRIAARWATAACGGGWKIHIAIENRTPLDVAGGRRPALMKAMHSAHWLLGIEGGVFVSALDPPAAWREAAAECRNEGLFPVLLGKAGAEPGGAGMLCAPIVLYDFPRLARESPGDFFDSTEIDEMLALRIETLTGAEKDAMRSDPRTRAMLERVEALAAGGWSQMHGRLTRAAAPVGQGD